MPWSPTQSFPHPLASINRSNADAGITNYVSYAIVEMMTWQGLGDIINRFREKSLGLQPIGIMWAPSMISRLKIPNTYCWYDFTIIWEDKNRELTYQVSCFNSKT
jgi:hypothetical protein